MKNLYIGVGFLFIAVIFFIKALDDKLDYLRIYHGIWHLFIGISFYYLWQLREYETI
jgi:predicted membrane channel-forming protein YqfA (hemolysin III family)